MKSTIVFPQMFQDRRVGREPGRSLLKERLMDRLVSESGDSSGYESGATQASQHLWRKQELEEQQPREPHTLR